MRQTRENQLPLAPLWADHRLSQELQTISQILDENPKILPLILHDLSDKKGPGRGAPGMTAEQVLRCALLKQLCQFSYRRLAFHLIDSLSAQTFCRLPVGYQPPASVLQDNIARIQALSWQAVNRVLVAWAARRGLERGRKVRIDATAVASEIEYPTDSRLLYDGIRVLTRLMKRQGMPCPNRCRRAKKRVLEIRYRRGDRRRAAYRDLIKVAHEVAGLVRQALGECTPEGDDKSGPLRHYLSLLERVIDQTERRVLRGESVPASQKVVSIFEPHSDIIEKGSRETVFGHKIYLSCGKSSLMLDCDIVRGNPADATQTQRLLQRQQKIYRRYPRQASLDGAFASASNLSWAKHHVKDVAFARRCGFRIEQMAKSSWVYRQLRRFRAGIEGCISTLKRVFGLRRCRWKGWQHFQQYVHLAVVSFNLIVLARLSLR
jgi:IS5 family transposase